MIVATATATATATTATAATRAAAPSAMPGWRRGLAALLGSLAVATAAATEAPARIQVGPQRVVKTLAEAARQVQGRALIEVDAGTYRADVAVWSNVDVTLRAVGGRVRLQADGAAAEAKAIWVVRGSQLHVEGFDFTGTRVPSANGAGIRFESGSLSVRDCVFADNENGILTGNDKAAVLDIENSEFARNGHGDGMSHNLYVGSIASLRVQGSWFHHAAQGHLIKSRAARNVVRYNLLADGRDGRASYELEFPSGGVAIVVGNLIQQAASTSNSHIVSFGVEGYGWPDNEIYFVNNTVIDERASGGVALRVRPGAARVLAMNNLVVGGAADLALAAGPGEYRHNYQAAPADLANGAAETYPLRAGSPLVGRTESLGDMRGESLRPAREYVHPRSTQRRTDAPPSPGAFSPKGITPR